MWAEAEEFTDDLNAILNDSWVKQEPTPHEIYIKGMLNEMKERLGDAAEELVDPFGSLGPHLYPFQLRSVHESIKLLERYRGMIIADVVGLGKTFVNGCNLVPSPPAIIITGTSNLLNLNLLFLNIFPL